MPDTPATPNTIEDAIITRLTAALAPRVTVDRFPDRPEEYDQLPISRDGLVLVAYRDGTFSEPQAMGLVVQEHAMTIEVHVITKSLRGPQGATALLTAVRQTLTGFRPASAGKLYPLSEQFTDQTPGRWVYAQTWRTTAPHVEDWDADDEAPFETATNLVAIGRNPDPNASPDDDTFVHREAHALDLSTGEHTPVPYPDDQEETP